MDSISSPKDGEPVSLGVSPAPVVDGGRSPRSRRGALKKQSHVNSSSQLFPTQPVPLVSLTRSDSSENVDYDASDIPSVMVKDESSASRPRRSPSPFPIVSSAATGVRPSTSVIRTDEDSSLVYRSVSPAVKVRKTSLPIATDAFTVVGGQQSPSRSKSPIPVKAVRSDRTLSSSQSLGAVPRLEISTVPSATMPQVIAPSDNFSECLVSQLQRSPMPQRRRVSVTGPRAVSPAADLDLASDLPVFPDAQQGRRRGNNPNLENTSSSLMATDGDTTASNSSHGNNGGEAAARWSRGAGPRRASLQLGANLRNARVSRSPSPLRFRPVQQFQHSQPHDTSKRSPPLIARRPVHGTIKLGALLRDGPESSGTAVGMSTKPCLGSVISEQDEVESVIVQPPDDSQPHRVADLTTRSPGVQRRPPSPYRPRGASSPSIFEIKAPSSLEDSENLPQRAFASQLSSISPALIQCPQPTRPNASPGLPGQFSLDSGSMPSRPSYQSIGGIGTRRGAFSPIPPAREGPATGRQQTTEEASPAGDCPRLPPQVEGCRVKFLARGPIPIINTPSVVDEDTLLESVTTKFTNRPPSPSPWRESQGAVTLSTDALTTAKANTAADTSTSTTITISVSATSSSPTSSLDNPVGVIGKDTSHADDTAALHHSNVDCGSSCELLENPVNKVTNVASPPPAEFDVDGDCEEMMEINQTFSNDGAQDEQGQETERTPPVDTPPLTTSSDDRPPSPRQEEEEEGEEIQEQNEKPVRQESDDMSDDEVVALGKEPRSLSESAMDQFDKTSTMFLNVVGEDGTIDPDDSFYCTWLGIVTVAVLYNIWMVLMRITFRELREDVYLDSLFLFFDVVTDLIFVADIFVHFHITYLEDGIKVIDQDKLRQNYLNSGSFVTDVIALFPVHILVYVAGDRTSYLYSRFINHLKLHVAFKFFDMVDGRTSYINTFRAVKITSMVATAIHGTACLYYVVSEWEGFGSNSWTYPELAGEDALLSRKYIRCAYWAMMTLTTIGETPEPQTNSEYLFTGALFLVGVMIFAAVVGNVGDVIANTNAARADFQSRIDSIKQYMHHRSVPEILQHRVKRWFNYSWSRTQALDEATLLGMLPDSLRAEIAVHIHMDTLSKVKIFQNFETHVLKELVLKLRSQIFSPGDFIIRQGDVGREMFIIKHGKVKIFVGGKLIRTLCEGSTFGEIALLGLGQENDVKLPGGKIVCKRTADAQSVGYSEVFILGKRDLMSALNEYPEAKLALEAQAKEWQEATRRALSPSASDNEGNLYSPGHAHSGPPTALVPATAGAAGGGLIELHELMTELRAFDSQQTSAVLDELYQERDELYAMVEESDAEIHRLMTRVESLEEQLRAVSAATSSNGINRTASSERSLSPTTSSGSLDTKVVAISSSDALSAASSSSSLSSRSHHDIVTSPFHKQSTLSAGETHQQQPSLSCENVALLNSSSQSSDGHTSSTEIVSNSVCNDLRPVQQRKKSFKRRSQSEETVDSGFADPSRSSRVSMPHMESFDIDTSEAGSKCELEDESGDSETSLPPVMDDIEEECFMDDDLKERSSPAGTSPVADDQNVEGFDTTATVAASQTSNVLSALQDYEPDSECGSPSTSGSRKLWQQSIMSVKRLRKVAQAFCPDPKKLSTPNEPTIVAMDASPAAQPTGPSPVEGDATESSGESPVEYPSPKARASMKASPHDDSLEQISSRLEIALHDHMQQMQTWWTAEFRNHVAATAALAAATPAPVPSSPSTRISRRPSALTRGASIDPANGDAIQDGRQSLAPSSAAAAGGSQRSLSAPGLSGVDRLNLSMPNTVSMHSNIVKGTTNWLTTSRQNKRASRLRTPSVDLPDVKEDASPKRKSKSLVRQPSTCGLTLVPKLSVQERMESDSDCSSRSGSEDEG